MICNTRPVNSNAFSDLPPTPTALRILWMAPYKESVWIALIRKLIKIVRKSISNKISELILEKEPFIFVKLGNKTKNY